MPQAVCQPSSPFLTLILPQLPTHPSYDILPVHHHLFKEGEHGLALAENFGFNSKELSFIEKILREYGDEFKIKFARHTGKSLDDK